MPHNRQIAGLLRRTTILVIAGTGLLVSAIGALTWFQFSSTQRLRLDGRHIRQVITATDALSLAVGEAERDQRDFLVTGQPSDLTSYLDALRRTAELRATLQRLTARSSAQDGRLRVLSTAIDGKINSLSQSIASRRAAGPQAVGSVSDTSVGRQLMSQVTQTLAAIRADEEYLLKQHEKSANRQYAVGRWLALGNAALALGLLIAAYRLLLRAEARRLQAEASLRELNADLDDRIAREIAARERAQEELAQALRMEALGQLAGGMAHDFNNVLQAIEGAAELIDTSPGSTARRRQLVNRILKASERGVTITRRLLAFSQRSALQIEPVDIAALLDGMREVFVLTLGDGNEIRMNIAPSLPMLLADKGQLEILLVNLATNARDAMLDNGTFTISAEPESLEHDDGPGHPRNLKAGSYVRLSVSDTGCGMEAATLARATEPFFSTKPMDKGTGLGLAMAKGFADQSGGGLYIESAPGRGTTVRLWLPVAPQSAAAPRPEPRHDAASADIGKGQLLLVDDDDIVREILAEQMQEAGYAVRSAANGAEALQLLNAIEKVDVIITDLSMPGIDGVSLIKQARRTRPEIAAILLTGHADKLAEICTANLDDSAFLLLNKPVSAAQLCEGVTALQHKDVRELQSH